jgi:hypothetical protein
MSERSQIARLERELAEAQVRAADVERKYHRLLLRWSNMHDSILTSRRNAEAAR